VEFFRKIMLKGDFA
jgi:hypothetical protein